MTSGGRQDAAALTASKKALEKLDAVITQNCIARAAGTNTAGPSAPTDTPTEAPAEEAPAEVLLGRRYRRH